MVTQTAVVGKCLETGESGKRTDTQLDALGEALNEVEAVERGQVEVLDDGAAMHQIGEGAGKAGGEEELTVLVVGELAAVTEAVALALLDCRGRPRAYRAPRGVSFRR